MSRKKPPVKLLGPDGAVLDVAKYRRKPEPRPEPVGKVSIGFDAATAASDLITGDLTSFVLRMNYGTALTPNPLRAFFGHAKAAPKPKALGDVVAEQIGALAADFEGTGHAELPKPAPDLHTYRDAYASAAAKCSHDDAIELLYGREWVCDACGRTLNRDDMRRARASRGIWGYFS